jgi:hypothetical protein
MVLEETSSDKYRPNILVIFSETKKATGKSSSVLDSTKIHL